MKSAAFVISRQSLRPTGETPWVRALVRATREVSSDPDTVFLCSLGGAPYELALTLLADCGASLQLWLSETQLSEYGGSVQEARQHAVRQYGLSDSQLVGVHRASSKTGSTQAELQERDMTILNRADTLYPVSIRPNGFMNRALDEHSSIAARVNDRYRVRYAKGPASIARDYQSREINQKSAAALSDHLLHWTRTANGPWPGEVRGAYYRDIINSGPAYVRCAKSTLRRIISEARLRGSSRHAPGKASVVAFTSSRLFESVRRMRYRARYREMTCEPYGIAIPREVAQRIGVQRISYRTTGELRGLSPKQRLYAHSSGENHNWEIEHEWRALGDIDLAPLGGEITLLVDRQSEAEEMERELGVNSLAVFAG
ncbi:MAG: hypothetical protein ACE5GA_04415 [Candidatus Zixiibacteriota bacterium]